MTITSRLYRVGKIRISPHFPCLLSFTQFFSAENKEPTVANYLRPDDDYDENITLLKGLDIKSMKSLKNVKTINTKRVEKGFVYVIRPVHQNVFSSYKAATITFKWLKKCRH